MRIVNGHIVFEKKHCTRCWGSGDVATRIACPGCKGTGNGTRGGRGGCKKCHGSGHDYDQVNRQTCEVCKGINPQFAQDETITDKVSDEDYRALPFKVYRSNREQSWNEGYLGHGCIVSVTDYGSHEKLTDEELVEAAKRDGYVQACKLVERDSLKVCDHIGIFCNRNGYSLRPVFNTVFGNAEAVANDAASELRYDEAHAVGGVVFAAGGNGTMAAATMRVKRA